MDKGNFDSENSYEFRETIGGNPNLLFADGPSSQAGEVFSSFCQASIHSDRFEAGD